MSVDVSQNQRFNIRFLSLSHLILMILSNYIAHLHQTEDKSGHRIPAAEEYRSHPSKQIEMTSIKQASEEQKNGIMTLITSTHPHGHPVEET